MRCYHLWSPHLPSPSLTLRRCVAAVIAPSLSLRASLRGGKLQERRVRDRAQPSISDCSALRALPLSLSSPPLHQPHPSLHCSQAPSPRQSAHPLPSWLRCCRLQRPHKRRPSSGSGPPSLVEWCDGVWRARGALPPLARGEARSPSDLACPLVTELTHLPPPPTPPLPLTPLPPSPPPSPPTSGCPASSTPSSQPCTTRPSSPTPPPLPRSSSPKSSTSSSTSYGSRSSPPAWASTPPTTPTTPYHPPRAPTARAGCTRTPSCAMTGPRSCACA